MSALVLCLATAWLAAGPAASKDANAARPNIEQLIFEFRYAEAEKAIDRQLREEQLPRAQVLRLFELQGVVAGMVSKPSKASAAFRALLSIDPEHKLGGTYAPRITTPFFEARAWVTQQRPITVSALPPSTRPGAVDEVGVRLENDPLKLVRSVRLHHRAPGGEWVAVTRPVKGAEPVLVATGGLPEIQWWAQVLGERGAVLLELESPQQPLLARAPDLPGARASLAPAELPPADASAPSAALAEPLAPAPGPRLRPFAYASGGLALAALGGGAAFGLRSEDARRRVDAAGSGPTDAQGRVIGLTEAEAHALDVRARQDAPVANALFGVAAAAAGTALVLFLLDPGPGPSAGAR